MPKTWTIIRDRVHRNGASGARMAEGESIDIDNEVVELLNELKKFDNIDEAKSLLDELSEIQTLLGLILFKYHVVLSPVQRSLVREFDRWDDRGERMRLLAAVKNGQYP